MSMPEPRSPELHIGGRLATIWLRRPSKANRLEPDDLSTLIDLIDAVNRHPEITVLSIRADGKYFSSGYDISRLASEAKVPFEDVINAVEDCRPVTVAVLQGGVYGGATDLALACDFRLGAEGIDAFMPAARLGLMFSPRELNRYVTRIGLDNTKRLFLTGQRIGAAEMREIGFLTALEPAEELEAAAQRLTEQLTSMAPLSILNMKKHLNRKARGLFDEADLHLDIARTRASNDRKEGIAAWAEKRPPRFTGT